MIEFVWLTASLAQVIQAKIITSFHNFLLSIVWNWALRMSADVLIAATRWIKACWMSPLGLKAGVVSLPTLQTLWKAFAMIAGHSVKIIEGPPELCTCLLAPKKKSTRHHYAATSIATVQYFFMFFSLLCGIEEALAVNTCLTRRLPLKSPEALD